MGICLLSFFSLHYFLDYQLPNQQYELRLSASDNKNENYTTVVIQVRDVNGKCLTLKIKFINFYKSFFISFLLFYFQLQIFCISFEEINFMG